MHTSGGQTLWNSLSPKGIECQERTSCVSPPISGLSWYSPNPDCSSSQSLRNWIVWIVKIHFPFHHWGNDLHTWLRLQRRGDLFLRS
ncbi:unnamed protein product [Brassica oleracea]